MTGSLPGTTAPGFRADGCRVFAGMAQARPDNLESIGREISAWLRANPEIRIVHLDTKMEAADHFVWLAVLVFFVGTETDPGPDARYASPMSMGAQAAEDDDGAADDTTG